MAQMPKGFWDSEQGREAIRQLRVGRDAVEIASEIGCTGYALLQAEKSRRTREERVPNNRSTWFWRTEEGQQVLHSLRDAANEEAYALVMDAAERQTGRTPEAIINAYRRQIGELPPGKPRRKPSFNDYMKAHPGVANEPAPRTQAEAFRDAWDAAHAQGAAPNERQPVMRVIFEFYQPHGRVTISGDGIEFGGSEGEPNTQEILLKALPAGGAVKGVRSFGSDT